MVTFSIVSMTALLSMAVIDCDGFIQQGVSLFERRVTSSTELFIIGPMIKKMRAEQAKKKMPMATQEERSGEANGLRVGKEAWKWPPIWPYADDEFIPPEDYPSATPNMASMLTSAQGMPSLPTAGDVNVEEEKLDVLKYWGEEKATVETVIDDESAKKLTEHYFFYLRDEMEILELGAAEKSYLPESLKLSRHIGVGMNQALMDKNPSLTESAVVDLNEVIEEEQVKSDYLRGLGQNKFDAIIMANTVDFLTHPRELFRSAWYLLKPGGTMFVAFTNKEAYSKEFSRAQTKMWQERNDDQHMWICGSFFQFSAGDGWESLKGFDISPASAKKEEGINALLNQNKGMNMFVVQASKAYQEESIDRSAPEKSIQSKMWLLPTVEERDKQLLTPRLARAFATLKTEEEETSLVKNLEYLPTVYEALIKMDQFSFSFSMQAQLATDLVINSGFNANDEQMLALRMGLGLRTPSSEFWEPVGQLTASMDAESKVNLLAHLIPRFGSGNVDQEAALEAFVSGLTPTFNVLKAKLPELPEADIQLLGTELLAAEILVPGRSSREEFASWLGSIDISELKVILDRRKSFKVKALSDMKQMQEGRQAEVDRLEALVKKRQEQQQNAREERTMIFNPESGKIEELQSK